MLYGSLADVFIEVKDEKNRGNKGNMGQSNDLTDCYCSDKPVTSVGVTDILPNESSMRNCSKWCVTSTGNNTQCGSGTTFNPDYPALHKAGITDVDVECFAAKVFLYAVSRVRSCPDGDFTNMCRIHVPFWRKRLAPQAWVIAACDIQARLSALKNKQGKDAS